MTIKTKQQVAKLVGKKIRTLRLERGISLKHFEVMENAIDRHSLSNIERGLKAPSIYTLYKIAKLLNVPPKEILGLLD